MLKQFQLYLKDNKLSTKKIKNQQLCDKLSKLYPHIDLRKRSVDHYIGISLKNDIKDKKTRSLADARRYLTTKFYERDENGKKIYVRLGFYNRLYMNNDQLNSNNSEDKIYYFKLFKQKLISFAFNEDDTINWSETVKETHQAIEKYNIDQDVKIGQCGIYTIIVGLIVMRDKYYSLISAFLYFFFLWNSCCNFQSFLGVQFFISSDKTDKHQYSGLQ